MPQFQHIPPTGPVTVNTNSSLPVTVEYGQSAPFTYLVPGSANPNGGWLGIIDQFTVYFGTTGKVGGSASQFRIPGPGAATSYQNSYTNHDEAYGAEGEDVVQQAQILLFPHNLPQVGGQGASSPSAFYICAGKTFNLSWNAFDVASAVLTDQNGVSYPAFVGEGTAFPTEAEWNAPSAAAVSVGAAVAPTVNTSYTLTVTGYGGETASSTISVKIIPFSATVSVDETNIVAGQPVHLTWSSVGASCVQFSGQIMPAGQAAGPVIAMDARGSQYTGLEPAIAQSGYGWPNFFGYTTYGAPNGWNYPADAYPSGTLTIYPQVTVTLFCTATSNGSCGTVKSNSVTITVSYPDDSGEASAGVTAGGTDTAKVPTGGSGGTTSRSDNYLAVLARLDGPYHRVSPSGASSSPAGLSHWRADTGNLPTWSLAASPVTSRPTCAGPSLALTSRNRLICGMVDSGKGAYAAGGYEASSDNDGADWSQPIMSIPNARYYRVRAGCDGGIMRLGWIDDGKKATPPTGNLWAQYQSSGDDAPSVLVKLTDQSGKVISVSDAAPDLDQVSATGSPWRMSAMEVGNSAPTEFFSWHETDPAWNRVSQ